MAQIPNSNMQYPDRIKRKVKDLQKEALVIAGTIYVARREKIIWPAVMLAANRKDRVIGRRRILIDSISTSAGDNQSGAPIGSRPAK